MIQTIGHDQRELLTAEDDPDLRFGNLQTVIGAAIDVRGRLNALTIKNVLRLGCSAGSDSPDYRSRGFNFVIAECEMTG